MPSDDIVQYLAGSSDRQQLMEYLGENPASPAELADSLPLARRTIQRHLSQFVERDWAEKSDGEYHLTMTGQLIINEHISYNTNIKRIELFDTFFTQLPDRDHLPEPQWFTEASFAEATSENPQAPVQHYIKSVRDFETDCVRMVSPVLSRLFHKAHAKLALDGTHTELVMSDEMINRARELNPTEFKIVVSVGVLDLYRYPNEISVGLTVSGDRILMGAYDNQGKLQACVDSTHPDFVQWGNELFEQYRSQATAFNPSFSFPFEDHS